MGPVNRLGLLSVNATVRALLFGTILLLSVLELLVEASCFILALVGCVGVTASFAVTAALPMEPVGLASAEDTVADALDAGGLPAFAVGDDVATTAATSLAAASFAPGLFAAAPFPGTCLFPGSFAPTSFSLTGVADASALADFDPASALAEGDTFFAGTVEPIACFDDFEGGFPVAALTDATFSAGFLMAEAEAEAERLPAGRDWLEPALADAEGRFAAFAFVSALAAAGASLAGF